MREYVTLPYLPTDTYMKINTIRAYYWNPYERRSQNILQYGLLTTLDPNTYKKGENPLTDFMEEDYVSPVMILDTDGNAYRSNPLFWLPLIRAMDAILIKQAIVQRRLLPQTIYIDEDKIDENGAVSNEWIGTLQTLAGYDILDGIDQGLFSEIIGCS